MLCIGGVSCSHAPPLAFWVHKSQVVDGTPPPEKGAFEEARTKCVAEVRKLQPASPEQTDLFFVMCMRNEDFALVERVELK